MVKRSRRRGEAGLKCTERGGEGLKFKDDLTEEVSGRINVMYNLNGWRDLVQLLEIAKGGDNRR
jgi:hypothetical protein